jgi:hypothetical protein
VTCNGALIGQVVDDGAGVRFRLPLEQNDA